MLRAQKQVVCYKNTILKNLFLVFFASEARGTKIAQNVDESFIVILMTSTIFLYPCAKYGYCNRVLDFLPASFFFAGSLM